MSRRSSPLVIVPLLMGLAAPVGAADLQGVRILEDDAGTRIELSLQGAGGEFRHFSLHGPERLVVDLPGSRLAPGFQLPAPNGVVTHVRTGQPAAGTLRVVFELGAALPARSRTERLPGSALVVMELGTPRPFAPSQRVAVAAPQPPSQSASNAVAPPSVDAIAQIAAAQAPREHSSRPAPDPVATQPAEVVAAQPAEVAVAPPADAVAARAPVKTVQDVIGAGQRKLVVAIDAGHGGKDPGAHGPTGVREKQVTLEVARELARQINADPGMRAVLIREGDSFVPLQQRYMKARSAQADLFISIHADASPNHSASGASVFVLSTRGASSQAARWLADQENAADLVGGVSLDQKDHNLAAVLLDLSQSATMRASDDVANQVLGALKNVGKAHKPQVERANFVVLRSPDVPSMLVETGFITNPSEEKRLADPGYRQRLASAITDGVRRYFTDQPPPGSWFASRDDLRPSSRMHVVARGETLSLIAARHGVGVDSIRAANRRNDDIVRVGEALTIPLVASAPK